MIHAEMITKNESTIKRFALFKIIAIAAIREKIKYSNVPPAMRGLGMAFLLTGLMGMAFMGLMGIDPAAF